jgi:hypothetical protein
VLFPLGIANIVVEAPSLTPDILVYMSSLTLNNPYVWLHERATALDGPRRARALRDVGVQIADLRPRAEVRYVALKMVDGVDGGLRKGRVYESVV